MSDHEQINSEQAADEATGLAVNAWLDGDKEAAGPLFQQAEAQHAQSLPRQDGSQPTPANEQPALSPMPPPPTAAAQVVSLAVNELSSSGAPGQALMQEWGGPDSTNFAENIGYARQAVQELSRSNPGILEFLGREQIGAGGVRFRAGDDPTWVKLAAEFGRLRAGVRGESQQHHQQRGNDMTTRPAPYYRTIAGDTNRLRAEMDDIMQKNPPGSPAYASPAVQRRLSEIHESLSGGGNIVGTGGRNA
jgi:hypothetical protein